MFIFLLSYFGFSFVAGATTCFKVLILLRVKIVILSALTRNIIWICPYNHAPLALRKLAHVDPDLFFVALTEITVVHVSLPASNRICANIFRLCLSTNGQLSFKAFIAARNPRVSLHTILYKLEARRALVGHQRRLKWSHSLALSAAHFALFFENVKCLQCIFTEQAGQNDYIWNTSRSEATRALRT